MRNVQYNGKIKKGILEYTEGWRTFAALMSIRLSDIQAPIAAELKIFEEKFETAMKSHTRLLDLVLKYIVRRKGKQMRPMFVLLSSGICGKITESTYTAATLLEILHTATLVHDDVVDDAYMRRGVFSVPALWKNKIAVLVGDYLLARGLLISVQQQEFRILEILSDTIREMSEGELLQLERARRLDITEDIYFQIIRQKTASLIASACASGAAASGGDSVIQEKMRQLGETIGLAFQIKDDLLDLGDAKTGKAKGVDLKEQKLTLPVIYTLQQLSSSERRDIIRIIRREHTKPERVEQVIALIKEKGGMDYAREKMTTLRDDALRQLNAFPDSPTRQAMEQLIHFTINRKH